MSNEQRKIEWPGWDEPKIIGRGSFGEVYEIQRNVFGDIEKAALKVISIPKDEVDIEDYYYEGFDKESLSMMFDQHLHSIVKEYSTMKKLSGCKNVVSCDDVRYVQHSNGIGWDIFIKMELLTPLGRCFKKDVPEKEIIKIGIDICNALEVCQKNNIIHRDIKPQNILRSDFGDYKLGDFGIAKTIEKTTGGTKIGTYDYMAPEIFNNQPYGYKADLYSLGLVLYWLANEKVLPFLSTVPTVDMKDQANRRRFLGEAIPAPKHGSEALKHVILKACSYNESDRFQNAAEMKKALIAVLRGIKPIPKPVHNSGHNHNPSNPPEPPKPPKPKNGNNSDNGNGNGNNKGGTSSGTGIKKEKTVFAIAASLAVIVFAAIIGFSMTERKSEVDLTNDYITTAPTTEVATEDVGIKQDESTTEKKSTEKDVTDDTEENHSIEASKSESNTKKETSNKNSNVSTTKANTAKGPTKKQPVNVSKDDSTSNEVTQGTSQENNVAITSPSTTKPTTESTTATTTITTTVPTTTTTTKSQRYYIITLYGNGGKIQGSQNYSVRVVEGATIATLPKPVRDNYRFLGWTESYNSSAILSNNTKIYKVYTLYAKWESKIVSTTTTTTTTTTKNTSNTYRITLKYFDEKNNTNVISVPAGAYYYDYVYKYIPTRSGCKFIAWSKNIDAGDGYDPKYYVNKNDKLTGNITLYARWKSE